MPLPDERDPTNPNNPFAGQGYKKHVRNNAFKYFIGLVLLIGAIAYFNQ